MHNIATIYRFNTPFLDLDTEREHLISVMKKVEKSIEFDGIEYESKKEKFGKYYKISLEFFNNLGRIELYYISGGKLEYYLPIFKLNIFLATKYLTTNEDKKNTIGFLNNIFECFDGLNEREFLIDINNNLYYKVGLFGSKRKASYDFSDIETIRELFETKKGLELVEDFIKKFSDKTFELTVKKSDYYHTLHSIFLYFIYLVFLMNQNIEKSKNTKKYLDNIETTGVYEGQVDLMNKRLSYMNDVNDDIFNKYKNRLELFFKLF